MKAYLTISCLLLLVCISTSVMAQTFLKDDAPITKSFYKKLKKAKVDSVLIYESGCIGCVQLADTSGTTPRCNTPYGNVSVYFIWKIKGESFIKKFDYCSAYQTIKLKNSTDHLFNFYGENIEFWNKDKDFWKTFNKLSFEEKFKLISPEPDHYGFDKIYFKNYEFEVKDTFEIQKIDKSLVWVDKQKEWVSSVDLFIETEHIKWKLDNKKKGLN